VKEKKHAASGERTRRGAGRQTRTVNGEKEKRGGGAGRETRTVNGKKKKRVGAVDELREKQNVAYSCSSCPF